MPEGTPVNKCPQCGNSEVWWALHIAEDRALNKVADAAADLLVVLRSPRANPARAISQLQASLNVFFDVKPSGLAEAAEGLIALEKELADHEV